MTKPRVTLSFELTRSGLLQLNKAEAKVDETYEYIPPTPPAKKKINVTSSNDTESEVNNTVPEPVAPVYKVRSIPYPLNRIERVNYGLKSLTKEQL